MTVFDSPSPQTFLQARLFDFSRALSYSIGLFSCPTAPPVKVRPPPPPSVCFNYFLVPSPFSQSCRFFSQWRTPFARFERSRVPYHLGFMRFPSLFPRHRAGFCSARDSGLFSFRLGGQFLVRLRPRCSPSLTPPSAFFFFAPQSSHLTVG